jgi:hypothetical protein
LRVLRQFLSILIAALLVCAIVPDVGWTQEDSPIIEAVAPATEAPSSSEEAGAAGVVEEATSDATTAAETGEETTGAGVEASPEPVWFGNVQLWEVLASIVALIWGVVKAKMKLEADWQQKLLSFVEAGAQHTYDEFIREAKKAAPDGKLTKEQINEARGRAWESAKVFAAEQGIDLAKQVAQEQIPVLLSKVVTGLKNKK